MANTLVGATLPINAPAYALGSGAPAAIRRDRGAPVPVAVSFPSALSWIPPLVVKFNRSPLRDGQAGRCPLLSGRNFTTPSFDDALTAPLHGFAGADAYYAESSAVGFLTRVAVPTYCLNAVDDPFFPPDAAARAAAVAASNTQLRFEVTKWGGHTGFVSGRWPWRPHYWAEEATLDWLSAGHAVCGDYIKKCSRTPALRAGAAIEARLTAARRSVSAATDPSPAPAARSPATPRSRRAARAG